MNIEFIKSEFEKLSLMLRSWKQGDGISTIERDIALDKLKNIYDALRFDAPAPADEASQAPAATAAPEPAAQHEAAAQEHADTPVQQEEQKPLQEEPEQQDEHDDVEVELIFAEEEEVAFADDDSDKITEPEPVPAPVEASTEPKPAAMEHVGQEHEQPAEPEIAAATQAPAPQAQPAEPEPAADKHDDAPAKADEAAAAVQTPQPAAPRSMSSLFGADEIHSRPRSKHHRMMSIYNDPGQRPEKVVDISKIFDMGDDAPLAAKPQSREAAQTIETAETVKPATQPAAPRYAPEPAPRIDEPQSAAVLGEAMASDAPTLADTLAKPEALADEMTHSRIRSLRAAIGINDKFLMIRDLFDGDGEAYERAILALDGFDSLDDCMIHIVENYSWNPDSEGAKFIMQLLERKLS